MVEKIFNKYNEEGISRRKHLIKSKEIAERLLIGCKEPLKTKILNTVLCHDIGYNNVLNKYNFHSYDGYLLLKELCPDEVFLDAILLHGDADFFCQEELKSIILESKENISELENYVLDLLDYYDWHSAGDGSDVSIEDRFNDMIARYPKNDPMLIYYLEEEGKDRVDYLESNINLIAKFLIKASNKSEARPRSIAINSVFSV